jgi:hypothetical protein
MDVGPPPLVHLGRRRGVGAERHAPRNRAGEHLGGPAVACGKRGQHRLLDVADVAGVERQQHGAHCGVAFQHPHRALHCATRIEKLHPDRTWEGKRVWVSLPKALPSHRHHPRKIKWPMRTIRWVVWACDPGVPRLCQPPRPPTKLYVSPRPPATATSRLKSGVQVRRAEMAPGGESCSTGALKLSAVRWAVDTTPCCRDPAGASILGPQGTMPPTDLH